MSKKRAFISVYNKDGIVEFAKGLTQKHGYEVVSTGGTYNELKNNNIEVVEIGEITGFSELLNGKVKSLHPNIHAGILAFRDNEQEMKQLEEHNIEPFDIVVVNLYPFEETSRDSAIEPSKLIDYIDIGGVTLLRSASKNYLSVTSVYSPDLYSKVLMNLAENNGEISSDLKQELAIKTFQYTSTYDSIISEQLYLRLQEDSDKMPEIFNTNLSKVKDLRYGENPHQMAALYKTNSSVDYTQIHGKELSYNNLVDMVSAMNIVSEFIDVPATCIIKHNNPCGVAIGDNIADAYFKALDCDPISAFGGIVGLNETATAEFAKMAKDFFLEVVIAPDFTQEAIDILSAKKNLRLIKLNTDLLKYRQSQQVDVKELPFGMLVQSADKAEIGKNNFNVVTKVKPTEQQVEDMLFAWKVCKHVKSNAIVVAKDKKTIGIGVGQTSRIASMEIALNSACDETKDAVIASDGFFPAIDNIVAAAHSRIGAIIQPGGSIKDKEVIAECDKLNISMITTGIRHFKH